jgi:outer membrane protein TolC
VRGHHTSRRATRFTGIALSVLVAAGLAGTALGQQAPTAPAPDAGRPIATVTGDGGTAIDGATPVTRSVSFQQAWEQALSRNPTVETSIAEVRRVTGLMEEVRASSLPTLGVTATYTRLNKDREFNAGGDAGTVIIAGKDSINITGSLAVPILQPQAWANWKRAGDQIETSRYSRKDVQRLVAANVARAYLTVFAQKRQVEVNIQARDNSKAHLDYADARLRGGIGNRIDWARAGEELESNEATLQTSYANLFRTQEALGILLGEPEPVDAQAVPELPDMPTQDQALAETSTRTDLLLARQQQTAADRSLNMSWTEYLPSVIVYGQPSFQSPASLTTPKTSWQVQAVLTWLLYDGGARYGRTHEREALFEQARIQLAATERQVKSDVRTSIQSVERTGTAVLRARNSARLAEEAMRLAEIAYRAGATTNLELIDAQRRARDAETQAVVAEDNARQAAIDLLSASGRFPPVLRQEPAAP